MLSPHYKAKLRIGSNSISDVLFCIIDIENQFAPVVISNGTYLQSPSWLSVYIVTYCSSLVDIWKIPTQPQTIATKGFSTDSGRVLKNLPASVEKPVVFGGGGKLYFDLTIRDLFCCED